MTWDAIISFAWDTGKLILFSVAVVFVSGVIARLLVFRPDEDSEPRPTGRVAPPREATDPKAGPVATA